MADFLKEAISLDIGANIRRHNQKGSPATYDRKKGIRVP